MKELNKFELKWEQNFDLHLNSKSITDWQFGYQLLLEYRLQYDKIPVPGESYKGHKLGAWCRMQKRLAKEAEYPKEQLEMLQEAGLFKSVHETNWEKHYQLLLKYIEEYQCFPKHNDTYQGFHIGNWYKTQKIMSKKPDYPLEHLEKLQQINFWDMTNDAKWDRHYQLLLEFIQEHQRFPKKEERYHNFNIGGWCKEQRKMAKKETYSLYRREKLTEIGFLEK